MKWTAVNNIQGINITKYNSTGKKHENNEQEAYLVKYKKTI